jgi:hypothetical protein
MKPKETCCLLTLWTLLVWDGARSFPTQQNCNSDARRQCAGWGERYTKLLSACELLWSGDRIPVGGKIFCTCPDQPWGPPSLLYNGYQVSFPGVKQPGRAIVHPPPSRAEAEGRAELYICSLCGPSWPVLWRTLPFTYARGQCAEWSEREKLCGRTQSFEGLGNCGVNWDHTATAICKSKLLSGGGFQALMG